MKLATLCYVKHNAHTLMLHRVKKENDTHAGKWNGLGGKLDPGESPEECAIREVEEESSLRARNPALRGILTFPRFSKGEDWYVFVFIIREFEGEVRESNEGHLAWIPDDEVIDLNLWEGDRIFLPWLEGPRFFSGKFTYEAGRLVDHRMVFHDFL